jgi:hypothetical protein
VTCRGFEIRVRGTGRNLMNHLYALLVGIDRYPTKPLTGCVNDVHAWRRYLEEWAGDEDRLSLEVLVNEEATRQAILEGFRGGLGRAGERDTAFFCFSGHGSQEVAPEPWCQEEPGGLSETLVAVDSRVERGLDIADKELAVLIAEVARGGAHVAVLLDSCHSGTATRDPEDEIPVRRMESSKWRRPAGSYWFEGDASVPGELDGAGGWRVLPSGPHVLLAACEDYQKAIECTMDGKRHGLFSYCLLDTLARLGPGRSYRDLFRQAQVRVQNCYPDQLPQAEGDLERGFLGGGGVGSRARCSVRRREDGSWWLDAGAVHGMQVSTELAILPLAAADAEDVSVRLASVRVVEVEAASSRVEVLEGEVGGALLAYPAVVTSLPLPPVRVALAGEDPRRRPLVEAVRESPYLALAKEGSDSDWQVVLEPNRWHLRRPGTGRDAVPPREDGGYAAPEVVEALEHAARWQTVADLASPGSPLVDAVEMRLCAWAPGGSEEGLRPLSNEGEVLLPYREVAGGGLAPPRFCVHLMNRSGAPVYYGLLGASEAFAIQVLGGYGGRLAGGEETWIGRASGIAGGVPDGLHETGVTQRRDLLVLLVSSVATDFKTLEQGGIFEPGARGPAGRSLPPRPGLLDTLLRRVAWRELDDRPVVAHQWAATRQAVVTVRPMPWVSLSGGGAEIEPVPGVRIRVPDGLAGAVRFHGRATHPGSAALARLPLEQQERLCPLAVAGALAADPGLSALEVRATGATEVSAASPFVLETEAPLRDGEVLAAVIWNGETAVLVRGFRDGSGGGGCRLEALPAPAGEGEAVWVELYALRE